MKYSIIIPCYNEKSNIEQLVKRVLPLCGQAPVEFVLVENGSTDGSRETFREKVEGKYAGIKVVYVEQNQGYGYGIQQGLKTAEGEYVGWIHADMQIPPEILLNFFAIVDKDQSGRKLFLKGHRIQRSAYERIFTYGQALVTSAIFRLKMYDIGAVPMLFERSLLTDIDALPNDFAIDIFVYREALLKGFKEIRYDVKMEERQEGVSTWNSGLKSRIRHSIRIMKDNIKIEKGEKIW